MAASRAARAREAARVAEDLCDGGWIYISRDPPNSRLWRATAEPYPLSHLEQGLLAGGPPDDTWAANWAAEILQRFNAYNVPPRERVVGLFHLSAALLQAALVHASRPIRAVINAARTPVLEWLLNNPPAVPAPAV